MYNPKVKFAVQKVIDRVNSGEFDTTEGERPIRAFLDSDGDISVEYWPENGEPWTTKVSYF